MDDKEFVGTVTPAEARKTIFEDVLGFKQEDLAGVKIGFNRGRIIIVTNVLSVRMSHHYCQPKGH